MKMGIQFEPTKQPLTKIFAKAGVGNETSAIAIISSGSGSTFNVQL
jgi:hypothetical protein